MHCVINRHAGRHDTTGRVDIHGDFFFRVFRFKKQKLRHDQGDDRAYAQVDLVGAYTSRHWDAIPERWALHPNIGAQFQRSFIEATADSFGAVSSGVLGDTEDYAAGWLRLRAEKKPRGPFELLPAIGLGLEAELSDSLDRESDESLWANLVLGAGMVLPHGARVDAEYNLHYGLTGTSVQHSVVLSLSAAF